MARPVAHTKTRSQIDMPVFVWEGLNKNGIKIRGETRAPNINMLKASLRRQGIKPKRIKPQPKPLFKPKIKPNDIAQFARQLTTMMKSGIPMLQSLELISAGHENPAMQDLLKHVSNDIASGNDLNTALRKHPRYFDDLFCNLVGAGETSGQLEKMLDKVATYKEKTEVLKSKIKKALMYPITVIVAAVAVTAIMLIFVIPQFKELFEGFGASLPAFTLFVIALSEWLQSWWWVVLGIIILAGYAFMYARRTSSKFHYAVDKMSLKLPIVGHIINKSAIVRFSRTLSTMFAAGVPLVESLTSVASATGNDVYKEATLNIQHDTSKGVQLNSAMQTTQRFPKMVVQMTKIGEESGRLEEMLNKSADYYEQQVDDAIDTLAQQIEPIIIVVLGVLVGGLIVAMYLPIFQLGSVI